MRRHRRKDSFSDRDGEKESPSPDSSHRRRRKKHRVWRIIGITVLVIAVLLAVARLFLPTFIRDYVNRTLDRNVLYEGRIGKVQVHLWRGAYSISDVKISKRTGMVPDPFFAAKRLDFAIQWDALLHGRVVGRFVMEQPELNFVSNPNEDESQTGGGGPWLQMIRDLFPFKINSAVVRVGSVHFRTYQSAKPVNIYLSHINGTIDDLGNISDQTNPLVTTVTAKGLAMDQANFEMKMTLDPFSYRPTFHLAVRMLGLDVTNLNDFAMTYGKFDFERGWFDLVIEAESKEGQLTGYVKPLFRNLKIFSLRGDLGEENALQAFWQALVGGVSSLFTNYRRDQFGTLIPFRADASGSTTTDIMGTIGNVLRNAFVRAYVPHLETGVATEGDFQFEPARFEEAISTLNTTQ
jgi:hypothetical protein